jgi:hypothetical protein
MQFIRELLGLDEDHQVLLFYKTDKFHIIVTFLRMFNL